jgi:hypothetical protein
MTSHPNARSRVFSWVSLILPLVSPRALGTSAVPQLKSSASEAYTNLRTAGKPPNSRWDVCCKSGVIASLEEHKPLLPDPESGIRFLSPSLCHPHIHLDKCFLLSHPKYADLQIEKGDFAEAMKLTSGFISFALNFHLLFSYR